MTQIATESGLMPAPSRAEGSSSGPGERVELIADFAGAARQARRPSQRQAPRRAEDARLEPRSSATLMEFRVGEQGRRHDLGPRRSCGRCPTGSRRRRRHLRRPGSSRSRAASARPGSSTARPSTPSAPTRSRGSARPRRGRLVEQDRGRPHDPPPRQRLVDAVAERQAAAAVGELPQGDVLHGPRRRDRGRRALQRPPRQVRDPLPHARPRGPRTDDASSRLWRATRPASARGRAGTCSSARGSRSPRSWRGP